MQVTWVLTSNLDDENRPTSWNGLLTL